MAGRLPAILLYGRAPVGGGVDRLAASLGAAGREDCEAASGLRGSSVVAGNSRQGTGDVLSKLWIVFAKAQSYPEHSTSPIRAR